MIEKTKFTKSTVQQLAPPAAGDRFVWDTEIAGFGLRIYASGRKVFQVQYRSKLTGNQARRTIGRFGVVTADEARSKARTILADNQLRNDPFPKAEVVPVPLQTLYERWVDDKATLHRKTLTPRSPASIANDKGRMITHVLPSLGQRLVSEITKADVEALRDLTIQKRAQQRKGKGYRGQVGGPGAARRVVATLKSVLAYGVDLGMLHQNPASLVRLPKEEKKSRFLTEPEFNAVVSHLRSLKTPPHHPYSVSILLLLCFTGCRRSEIERLRWSEVSLASGLLHLARTKTGRREVWLNAQAFNLLKSQKRSDHSEFVFPSLTKHGTHHQGADKLWRQVRAELNLPAFGMHDIRHGYASLLALDGTSLQLIGKLLGHKKIETTQRYAHLLDDEVRRANDRLGDRLKLQSGKKPKKDRTQCSKIAKSTRGVRGNEEERRELLK